MPQSFFEGATVTITDPGDAPVKASLSGLFSAFMAFVRPYSGPAIIQFLRGDDQAVFETKNVTVTEGKLASPVTQVMPTVKPTESSYDVRVVCKYKDVTKQMLFCTIWPKKIKLLFQDPGNQPVKSAAFYVKQQGVPDQDLVAGADGKSTVDLIQRGPYSIQEKGKFLLLKDEQVTPGQYRDHKITVQTAITAKFLSPDVSAAIYLDDADASPAKKQWINLKSKEKEHDVDSGCDAKGHTVVFAVTADPPEAGQPGDRVYFEINFGRESKRDKPVPTMLGGWGGNEVKVQGNKTTGYVVLAPVGASMTGYFELELGEAGGDTCEVKIGGTSAVADAKLKLINWRKIYTQITRTAALTKPSLAPAQTCFKKVQIDLEEATADEVLVADADVPGGSIVAGTAIEVGAPAQTLVVGDHNVAPFKAKLNGKFKADGLPVAHLIFCNYQLDANGNQYTRPDTLIKGKKVGQVQGTVAFPGGGSVPGVKVDAVLADASALFTSVDLTDGTDAVKSCTWKEVGGSGSGTIASADYKIDRVNNGDSVYIRLPAAAKALSDAGSDITVTVKVAYALGWYNGWCTSGDRHNVIAVGRPDQDICGTIVHEIGHAIYQAAKSADATQYPGLPAPPHARFYTNNRGHMGPHCADGIDDASYNNPTIRMDTSNAGDKCTCIMYGAGADVRNANLAFCDKCVPYVRAALIKTVST